MIGSGTSPGEGISNTRLADALRGRRWRLRTGIGDLRFEVQGSRDRRFEPGQPLATLHGTIGGARAEITLAEAFVADILARAPDPVTLAALEPGDAALMAEPFKLTKIASLKSVADFRAHLASRVCADL